jgi:DNA mismatch repair protein MutL
MPEGTEIIVEDLFKYVPARKNFLRDTATELRAIVALVNQYALAYPQIGFSLTNEHKHILDLRAQNTSERIRSILGQEIHSQLIPVQHETEFGTLSGFIGTPQLATPHASHQHFFLNNRVIDSRAIGQEIIRAYGTLLEKVTHPPFVLWLALPHTHVDVNVHPRKDTVRFLYPDNISELVNGGVKKTLQAHDLAYKDRGDTTATGKLHDTSGNALLQDRHMDVHLANMLKDALKLREQRISPVPIIQVHNTYLITETPDGVLLVDQHAAHERVLFEKFLHTFEHVQAEKQIHPLEKAMIIELSDEESILLEDRQEVFAQLGFDIESFGPRTFKVSSVPKIYQNRSLLKLIPEVLHDLLHHKEASPLDHETKRTLSFLACRSAIKAGDPLTEADTRILITELSQCTVPYTCPHGRPTHIELSRRELDKMFKRVM